ncbi:hypothetical protein PR048_011642 [Dryococelus australis]|uniref:Uncharacterized protein n=1 Tax=Dryococelus australis TaxID=614101 RepID=A0ABQ9HMN6_9NEOP|nr:hypothetical protein PR048_011642 [Dryococelus australis]
MNSTSKAKCCAQSFVSSPGLHLSLTHRKFLRGIKTFEPFPEDKKKWNAVLLSMSPLCLSLRSCWKIVCPAIDDDDDYDAQRVELLHDNARPCVACTTTALLHTCHWQCLPHPPCSPDLAHSDFHLFGKMK